MRERTGIERKRQSGGGSRVWSDCLLRKQYSQLKVPDDGRQQVLEAPEVTGG